MSANSTDSYFANGWTRLVRCRRITALAFGALLLSAVPASANFCELDPTTGCTVDGDCVTFPGDRCILALDPVEGSPDCMEDVYQNFGTTGGDLNCTAGELKVVETDVVIIDGCDYPGDTATVELIGTLDRNGGGQTYDIGIYLGLMGDALFGPSCNIYTLPYAPTTAPGFCTNDGAQACTDDGDCSGNGSCAGPYADHDGTGDDTKSTDGFGYCGTSGSTEPSVPIRACNTDNTEPGSDPCPGLGLVCNEYGVGITGGVPIQDTCGDVQGNDASDPLYFDFGQITIECLDVVGDEPPDGKLDLPVCISWKQQGDLCLSPFAAFPGTAAKCRCEGVTLDVPIPGAIVVDKVTDPALDPTIFAFVLDGGTLGSPVNFDLTDTDDPFIQGVAPGAGFSVTETAVTGWGTTVVCTNDNGTVLDTEDDFVIGDPTNFEVLGGQTVTCVFTNTLLLFAPDLTVQKDNDADDDGVFTDTETVPGDAIYPVTVPYEVTITNGSASDATIPVGGITDDKHDISGLVCERADTSTFGLGDLPQPIAAGETITCTFSVTFDNADQGSVTNIFEVTAENEAGSATASDPSTVNAEQNPALSIDKTASPTSYSAVDNIISYSYLVTNTGNVTISGPITVSDDLATDESCPAGDLAPGESMTCTASYTITQADLDAGFVTNVAFATGTDPDGNPVNSPTDTETVTANQSPALTLVKSTTTTTYAAVGDLIDYSYAVTNSGNVTLAEPVTIADDKTTATCALSGDGDLDVDETVICTAVDYVVTQADIDAGSVTNLATASADGTDSNQDSVTVEANQSPALTLVKSTTTTTYAAVGDLIDYSYAVTNSGNVTLAEPVTIADDKTTATCALSGDGDLDVDETVICTAVDYVVTQADIDAGSVTNLATASADGTDSNQDSVTVEANQSPALTLVKSTTTTTYAAVGDLIDYSYAVTNSGNVTLAEPVTIADDKTTATCALSGDGDLDVDETVICTAVDYVVTQADIDAGSVTNLATASADGTDSNQDSVTVTANQSPALTLVKSTTTTTYAAVGDLIDYSYAVTNSGNVTLAEPVTIADDKTTATCALSGDGDLDVDETVICTAVDYVVTQADIDAGSVTNLATASADGTDSNQDSVTVEANQSPALTLVKSTTTTTYAAVGDLIDYSYAVTNSGNVTLAEPVTIADDKTTATCALSGDGDLDVDETVICTAVDYVVTQADIDAGSVTNLATASADGTDSNQDSVTVEANQSPALTLVKSTTTTTYAAVGDLIDYSYAVTNSGNVTLAEPVTIADDKTTATCALSGDGDLDVDETVICTAVDYVVTQADIDAGSVTNLATASADGTDSNQDSVTVEANQSPALTLVKSTTTTTYAAVGDLIDYSYAVTNSGNVTLAEPVTIADDKTTATCALSGDGDLDVDETVICTAVDYVVTQADIDAGSVTNLATASADGTDSNQDSVTVEANQSPALTLVKSTTTTTYAAVGDLIDYSYAVTNSGNVTLAEPVTIADDKTTATCALSGDGDLDVDETVICTAVDYVVTQADIDAGSVTNLATASADGTDSNQDSVTVEANQSPALTLVKSTTTTTYAAVGDLIDYSYAVTNSGNVTLAEPVTIADDKTTATCALSGDGDLDVDETVICTAVDYVVTQADIDAGSVTNLATASADGTDSNQDSVTVEANQSPALTLVKSTTTTTYAAVGDLIDYSYAVTNSGNVTLAEPVTIADDKTTATCALSGDGDLDVDETVICTAVDYVVTQADIDAGSVTNLATASADGTDSNQDSVTVEANQSPALTLVKSTTTTTYAAVGDLIDYSYAVTNSGNVTLAEPVTIADDKTTATCALSGDGDLDVDETVICTAVDYVVTQADIDAGSVTNLATASADGTDSNQDSVTVTANQSPALTLVKSTTTTTYAAVGDLIDYSYAVTNSGNVTLAEPVTIADDKTTATCALSGDGDLDVDETVICTAVDYVVTQADIDAGSVTNLATASADGTDSNQDSVTVEANQSPALTLVKSTTTTTYAAVGDLIDYSYAVTNSGNVTLAEPVTIADDKTTATCALSGDGDLDVDETVICTAVDYVVTQADIDAGSVTNLATASADGTDSNQDSVTVEANQSPALTLVKSTTTTTYAAVGDLIDYSYAVTNSGNVTLAEPVTIADDKTTATCALSGDGDLDVDETVICTAVDYVVTQADIDAGSVTNLATASADGTDSNQDSVTVEANQSPALTLVKSTTTTTYAAVGDLIDYSYAVTNSGNVTLAEPVTIADDKTTATCALSGDGDLDVDETVICTAVDYVVTQADIDAGSVTNLATASADGTDSNQDSVTVNAEQNPALSIDKTASPTSYSAVDNIISYSYLVTNTGNVTISGPITVSDDLATDESCPAGDLAPGESMTCTASYTITQADLDAGSVTNVAYATGTDPDGNPVNSPTDTETVTADQSPALALDKTASPPQFLLVGDVITYTYLATNTGNITLTGVTVVDPMPGLSALTCVPTQPGTLAPTESMTCTATYSITQADLDAGEVVNTATADSDQTDSVHDTETVVAAPGAQVPAIQLEKTSSVAAYNAVGDEITYTYVVTNVGTVTLTGVTLVDPLAGLSALTCTPTQPSTLAPTDSMNCTATYTITQVDLDAGQVVNTATADSDQTDPVDDTVTVTANQAPDLTIDKTATPATYSVVGDLINYTFVVTNTGNVTIFGPITVSDDIATDGSCPAGDLAPGESMTCTASHSITQADLDAGSVTNVAFATGTDPDGNLVDSPTDTETVTANQNPALSLDKTAAPATYDAVGQVISYSYLVTNTGNTTMYQPFTIDDDISTDESCPAAPASLAPGESITCTASHTITQADLDAGSVTNVATATGQDPNGEPVDSNPETETVTADQNPTIDLLKDGALDLGPDGVATPGDLINYTFVVTNTGNVTLTDVSVTDPLVSPISCPSGNPVPSMAPNAMESCTGSYALTQADIDAGVRYNLATATGHDSDGAQVTDTDDHSEPISQLPLIDIEKATNGDDADTPTGPQILENEPVTWSYVVTNLGNVTLINVVVTDDQGLSVDCGSGSNTIPLLPPGGQVACAAGDSATLGQYENVGTASGFGPLGQPAGDADPSHYFGFTCDLTLEKTCVIPAPPPSDFTCDTPIDCLTMIWNGTSTIRVKAWKGAVGSTEVDDIDDIAQGQPVEICGFAGSPNDVIWEIFEAGTSNLLGESKFHLSCSDDQMDGAEDCGSAAGNGKGDDQSLINDWIFDGMVGAGGPLLCTPSDPIPGELCEIPSPTETLCEQRPKTLSLRYDGGDCTQSSNTQDPSKVHCDDDPSTGDACDAGKPTALVFEYLGGDCSVITNNQGGKVQCVDLGTPTGPVSVVMLRDADKIDVTPTSGLNVGEVVDIARNDGQRFAADTEFSIVDDGTGTVVQTLKFHTSCSQPLDVGDVFGPVKLVEYTAEDGTIITLPPEDPNSTCETVFVVAFNDSDFYRDLTADPVDIGDVFTIDAAAVGRNDLDSEITFQITDAVTGEMCQEVAFHTSCSQDLRLGDQFGSLEVVGFTNTEQGVIQVGSDVNYFYTVTNVGSVDVFDVVVVDDQGLDVMCPFDALAVGNSMTCVAAAYILDDTTNVGTVRAFVPGDSGPGSTCETSDSATVTILPPPPCSIDGESTLKLDKKKLEWKLTNTGHDVATIDNLTATWPASNGNLLKVKFDGDTIWEGSIPSTSATLTSADWINDLEKRQIPLGDTDTLKLEFENNVDKIAGNYAITVNFAEACSVTFDPIEGAEFECIKPIDCLTMIWQGPATASGSDTCDVGDPIALAFEYNGGDCSVITNTQNGKAECIDFASPTGPVSVVMTSSADDISVTPATVSPGEWVTLTRTDGQRLSSETAFIIVDAASGTVLHSIKIHTSCSQVLSVGDQFGPVTLVEYTADDGTVVVNTTDGPVSDIRVKAWKGAVGSSLLTDIDSVIPGDEVTVCGFAGSANDVTWEIFEAGTEKKLGESMFHLSCSDDAMSGPEDCGAAQGDGKNNDSSLINGWLLEGIVAAGGTLECSGGSTGSDSSTNTSVGTNTPDVTGPGETDGKLTKQRGTKPRSVGGRKRSHGRR